MGFEAFRVVLIDVDAQRYEAEEEEWTIVEKKCFYFSGKQK